MSDQARAEITIPCWDGEYTFRLALGDVRVLQQVCGTGIQRMFDRLAPFDVLRNPHGGSYLIDDIREPIRLGLLRGDKKKTPDDVRLLLARFVDDRPIAENRIIAGLILQAFIAGVPEEPVGKAKEPAPAMATDGSSTTEESPLPPSMAPVPPPSDGLQPRSTT